MLAQCSAAGDQSPRMLINKAAEERMRRLQARTDRQDIGIRIADAVTQIIPVMAKEIDWEPRFAHQAVELPVTRRKVTEEDVQYADAEAGKFKVEYNKLKADLEANPWKRQKPRWYVDISRVFRRMLWNEVVAERFAAQKTDPTVNIELHIVRLGAVAFATNPFEYYLDFGQRIKARSQAIRTFVVQLAGFGTYLPTPRAIAGKSYGAVPSSTTVGPEGGQMVVETTLEQIARMWA